MAAPYYLADEALTHLVTEGLVQRPSDTGDLPTCYSNKRDSIPEPTAVSPVVCVLSEEGDILQDSYLNGWRQKVLRVGVTAKVKNDASRLSEDIRLAWENLMMTVMGDLEVLWVRVYTATQNIPVTDRSFFYLQTDYQFMLRTRALNEGT